MGEITDPMGEWITGLSDPPGPDQSSGYNARMLAEAVGGGRAAARLMGVPESTYRGWRHDVAPKGGQADLLVLAARTAWGTATGNLTYARGDGELAIQGTISFSTDTRVRTIHPGRYIPHPLILRALTYWAQGRDGTAEALISGAIGRYYQPLEFDSIDRVWFE